MNLTHSNNDAVNLDPRWLIDQSDHGIDGLGFWARPFADETSLLRIDFFDPWQDAVWSDGLCRLSSKDRNGARKLQRVAPSMRIFEPGGTIDKDYRQAVGDITSNHAQEFLVSDIKDH